MNIKGNLLIKHLDIEYSILLFQRFLISFSACYGRNFGPRGYGYGTGAGILQTT